jgi:hypothetical protein
MRTRPTIVLNKALQLGVTLPELCTTLAIAVLTLSAVLGSHIMGLKMYNVSAAKLGASAGARSALNTVRGDVRSAKLFYVGNGSEENFSRIAAGAPQVGNAVLIYPSAATNNWIRYFVDPGTQTLRRKAGLHSSEVVAKYVTNQLAFQAETHFGTVLTNNLNHRVVRMLLEFYQWEYPVAKVGGHYDYYRLHTRVTRRAIE